MKKYDAILATVRVAGNDRLTEVRDNESRSDELRNLF